MTRTRLRSRLITGTVALACVIVATVGIRFTEPGDFQVVRGSLGQPVSVREGEVTVDEVRYGNRVLEEGDVTATTAGMFVAVHVSSAAPGRTSLALSHAQLSNGDRTYLTYSILASVQADPGFESEVDLLFEVDPARIDDLVLELWPLEIVGGYHQRIRVPLGLTPASVAAARASSTDPIVDPEIYPSSRVIR